MSREVVCPGCKGRYHQTTDRFDPDASPNGAMFELMPKYGPDGYNWSSFPNNESMRSGDLSCPWCGASYIVNGKVSTVPIDKPQCNVCNICNKKFDTPRGLKMHTTKMHTNKDVVDES